MNKGYIVVLLAMFLTFGAAAPVSASHSEGHSHYLGTSYNVNSTTGYCSGTTFVQQTWTVDRNWYDIYSHDYVLFDLWYEHRFLFDSYSDTNKRLQGTYYYPGMC